MLYSKFCESLWLKEIWMMTYMYIPFFCLSQITKDYVYLGSNIGTSCDNLTIYEDIKTIMF